MIDISIANKNYSVNHPLYMFIATLHDVQAKVFCLPKWNDFEPIEYTKQLLYYIEEAINAVNPKHQEPYVKELTTYLEVQLDFLTNGLKQFKFDYITSTIQNHEFFELKAAVEQCVYYCAVAHERIKYEASNTSPNILFALEFSLPSLYMLSKLFYSFAWVYSTNDEGAVIDKAKLHLLDEDSLKKLNLE